MVTVSRLKKTLGDYRSHLHITTPVANKIGVVVATTLSTGSNHSCHEITFYLCLIQVMCCANDLHTVAQYFF